MCPSCDLQGCMLQMSAFRCARALPVLRSLHSITSEQIRVSHYWPQLMQELWVLTVPILLGMLLKRAGSLTLLCQQSMSLTSAPAELPQCAAQRECTTAQDLCRPQNAPGSTAVTEQDMLDSTIRQAAAAARLRLYSRSIRLEMYCTADLFHGLSR